MPARVQVSKPEEAMAARIALRVEDFRVFANLKWRGLSDEQKAREIGVDPATYSRILNRKQAPGERFIAAALTAFAPDGIGFSRLFDVIDDDPEPTAVPA